LAPFFAHLASKIEKITNMTEKNFMLITNMSKSGKSAYFRHVFANNLFFVYFLKTFSTDLKPV